PNARVVGGDDYFAQAAGFLTLFHDMADEWFARNERERFARKAGRTVTRWNDAGDFHFISFQESTSQPLQGRPRRRPLPIGWHSPPPPYGHNRCDPACTFSRLHSSRIPGR